MVGLLTFETDQPANQSRVVWKIPHSELPVLPDSILMSPSFRIYETDWCLKIYFDKMRLVLFRLSSPSPIRIFFYISIKCWDGSMLCLQKDMDHEFFIDGEEIIIDQCLKTALPCTWYSLLDKNISLNFKLIMCRWNERKPIVESTHANCTNDHMKIKINQQKALQTLLDDLKELYVSGSESDFVFRVQGKQFPVHRMILTARSSVFKAMMQLDMAEKKEGAVDINDCDPWSFEAFLLFMYTGKLDVVTPTNALGLYATAKKYQVDQLKVACSECLAREMSVDSVCDVICLATLHDEETELLHIATEYFIDKADEIVKTPKWLSFLTEHPSLANGMIVKMTSRKYNKEDCAQTN